MKLVPINIPERPGLAIREDGWVYMCFSGGSRGVLHSCSATPPITPPCDRDTQHVANPEPGQMLVVNRWAKPKVEEKKGKGWKKGRR